RPARRTCLSSSEKPSGSTRCSMAPAASAVRPRFPVFQWISGSTRTRWSTPRYSMGVETQGLRTVRRSSVPYDRRVTATRILSRPVGRVIAVRRARLRVARGPSRGEQLELSSLRAIVIGSDPDADLVLADDTVSARHAEIRPTERGWTVRDLGSTNGVVIHDVRVSEALLDEHTKRLALGESELEWKLSDDEVEHLLAPTPFGGLVGDAPAMRALFALVEQAAPSDST